MFTACLPPPPTGLALAGLAVTTHHYLAAGYVAADEQGLLLFDLQAGGAPMRLLWPAPFAPFDLADTPDGGLLVLDRRNAAYFQLDEHFRLRGHVTANEGPFRPAAGGPPESFTGQAFPVPNPLHAGSPLGPIDAISIEPGPDPGTVLILDSDAARGYSVVHLFDSGELRWSASLADAIEVIDPADPTDTPQQYSLLGLDFAYLVAPPATGPLPPPMLYIADAEGKQVVAFGLDATSGVLEPRPDFLPLRRWDGKALVRAGVGAWYDFGDRWVPLEIYTECRFERSGSLTTPAEFATIAPASATTSPPSTVPGQTFDSQLPGCVWHRLLLDAAAEREREHGGAPAGRDQGREVLGGGRQAPPRDIGPRRHRALLAGVHPRAERAERPVGAERAVPLTEAEHPGRASQPARPQRRTACDDPGRHHAH